MIFFSELWMVVGSMLMTLLMIEVSSAMSIYSSLALTKLTVIIVASFLYCSTFSWWVLVTAIVAICCS